MIRKLIYVVFLLLNLSLLWGCRKPAQSFLEIPIPEMPLPSDDVSLSIISDLENTVIPSKNQSIVLWRNEPDDGHIYVGLLDVEHAQVVPLKAFEFHHGNYNISWSPDGSRFILIGINQGRYDIAVATPDDTTDIHYLHKDTCCGLWCSWVEDGTYVECSPIRSMIPHVWLYDASNWEMVCSSDDEFCPPFPLSDGRWLHMDGLYIHATGTSTTSTTSPSKRPTLYSYTSDPVNEICNDDRLYGESDKCHWGQSFNGRFLMFREPPILYVFDTGQRQFWKVTEKYEHNSSVIWSPDERYLAWVYLDGQVHLFDTEKQTVRNYNLPGAMIWDVDFIP